MISLVILAASALEISRGKKQTQTEAAKTVPYRLPSAWLIIKIDAPIT